MRSFPVVRAASAALVVLAAACTTSPRPDGAVAGLAAVPLDTGTRRLPNGQQLDPAGRRVDVLPMPLAMLPTPDGDALVLLGSGWGEEGVQVLDRATGRVRQTVSQRSAFVGLAWAPAPGPDGARTLYASGGNDDVVYRYRWAGGRLSRTDSLVLAAKRTPSADGRRYPAGLALSPDGRRLYVAENLGDSLAVLDVANGRVVQRIATERYPYAVVVAPGGRVFVSAWGGTTVSAFDPDAAGALTRVRDVPVARHPSSMLLDRAGRRLFVASTSTDRIVVLDARTFATIATLDDPPPASRTAAIREGSTPAAFALSPDESHLYVAESDNNAVATFALDHDGRGTLRGRAPVGWYPTAIAMLGDTVYAADGKGRGTAANPDGPQPRQSLDKRGSRGATTTLSQIGGTVTALPVAGLDAPARLAAWSARVARANGWDGARAAVAGRMPPFQHVVYVIKENRTYDQILGDLPQADGDSSLTYFPRANTPNHHALAERFGIFDRFLVNAEVSGDGHNWSTAAYATDYVQKTVPLNYSSRGRSYDYEGTNRGFAVKDIPSDDVAEPANGYLWDLARAAGTSFRDYGEFVVPEGAVTDEGTAVADQRGTRTPTYRATKAFLRAHTDTLSPGFDMNIPDQRRADRWIAELQEFARAGRMPALELVRLSNDHTAGARIGSHTPRAYLADNDLALGRMIEALSRSPFWGSTVVFVVEDDAQNGPDHVDSHRAPFLAISAWSRPGAVHRWTNTTDVLATIEDVLGLGRMSQFDAYARPLRDVWATAPDLRPYTALAPSVPLVERNTAANTTPADARASAHLALDRADAADEATFNRVLWRTVKGTGLPYPVTATRRASGHALLLAAAAR